MTSVRFIHGDCLEKLYELEPDSFDACVTDPPFMLGMAKWDAPRDAHEYQSFCTRWARGVWRALKPGAFLLACGGSPTSHRLVSGIEDVGFKIITQISWFNASRKPASRTHLRAAADPICLAQKPGGGSLNIDACRLPSGRWPSNVIFDEDAARELDAQTGTLTSGSAPGGLHRHTDKHRHTYGAFRGRATEEDPTYGDSGGASRFFPYYPRASPAERNKGCEDLYWDLAGDDPRQVTRAAWETLPEADQGEGDVHSTVKPLGLMRWLVRLVAPPSSRILDPFCGSGTTGVAAKLEGHDFVGIDQCAAYITISERRYAAWERDDA